MQSRSGLHRPPTAAEHTAAMRLIQAVADRIGGRVSVREIELRLGLRPDRLAKIKQGQRRMTVEVEMVIQRFLSGGPS